MKKTALSKISLATSLVIVMVTISLGFPQNSQAFDYTDGNLTGIVKIYEDGTGFIFVTDQNGPCGEAGYFVSNIMPNYFEIYAAVMQARKSGEKVTVASDGCWSQNAQFQNVVGITVGVPQ